MNETWEAYEFAIEESRPEADRQALRALFMGFFPTWVFPDPAGGFVVLVADEFEVVPEGET